MYCKNILFQNKVKIITCIFEFVKVLFHRWAVINF